jgi:exodeoxyribonuclease V alpha subunit
VLRVQPFDNPHQQETVIVHQTKVFAGATMEFRGAWTVHPRHGRQFKAIQAVERKPADSAALEKYLGSGLIKGVGPKTAKKIVRHFGKDPGHVRRSHRAADGGARHRPQKAGNDPRGLARHRAIREVMMFLQSHGISTLFAVRIYQAYGDNAIAYVSEDPYRLAADFTASAFSRPTRWPSAWGLAPDSPQRIMAGIRHVLAASREFGPLLPDPVPDREQVEELLGLRSGTAWWSILAEMAASGS